MVDHFNIENGHLICYYKEEKTMAKVDLGNVKGEKGDTGAKGDKGDPGISPTFTIEADGHLYADYDNPYTP